MGCCTAQSQPPPVGQPRPSSPPAVEAIRGAAGSLCCVQEGGSLQRFRILSCPAWLKAGSFSRKLRSEVLPCPTRGAGTIRFSCAIQVARWGAVHSHQCPFPCVQGRRAQQGEGEHPWLGHWGWEEGRGSLVLRPPRPARLPAGCGAKFQ